MRETVTIQVGQCGNQIGNQFWSLLLQEHQHTPDTDDALSAYFHFSSQPNHTKAMKARALLIDMECGPLQETMRSPLGSLFDETQLVMDVYGSGNNFAHGFGEYGPKYQDKFLEGIRRVVETCESLQTFLVIHSLGGGTGSGVGSFLFSLLEDYFPRIYRFSNCVYPSPDDDVVTSPYNCVLSTNELLQHADCVFPIHNHCLQQFVEQENAHFKKQVTKATNSRSSSFLPENKLDGDKALSIKTKHDRGFDDMNKVAARMLCHLTSSSRFHGEMNVDLNEIYSNLIPFPRINFLSTAMSLQRLQSGHHITNVRNQIMLDQVANSTRTLIQRSFTDVLSKPGQLSSVEPAGLNQLTGLNHLTLASAFISRGNIGLSDFLHCVTNAQNSLKFPSWNPDACKIGMCGTPAPGEAMSVLGIFNNTGFGSVLSRDRARFLSLYRRKAMLHHYTEFMEADLIARADENVARLIQDYEELENNTYVESNRRESVQNTSAKCLPTQEDIRKKLFPAF